MDGHFQMNRSLQIASGEGGESTEEIGSAVVGMLPVTVVEDSWEAGMFRMEVWMTAATAKTLLFLPDPDLLVVGEADGTVRMLDEKTRGPTTIEKVHAGGVTSLVHAKSSQTNLLFASTGKDGKVRLWAESEKKSYFEVVCVHDFGEGTGEGENEGIEEISTKGATAIGAVAPKPKQKAPRNPQSDDASLLSLSDSTRVVHVGTARETATVFDVTHVAGMERPGLVPLFAAGGHLGGIKHADSFQDYLSTVDQGNTFRVWSARSRAKMVEVDGAQLGNVTCLWSRGSSTLMLGRGDGAIEVREFPRGEVRHVVARHTGKVTHLELVGDIIISGGDDVEGPTGRDCVRFCNARSGNKLASFTTAPVTCMCVRTECGQGALPGSRFALTGHADGKAVLWDVAAQRSAHILDGHHKAARAIHANRFCAVSGGEDSTCRVWRFADTSVIAKEEEELAKRVRKAEAISHDAKKAYGARRLKEALRLYTQAAELAPGVLKYLTNISAVHFEMGDNALCIAKCREFLSRAQHPLLVEGPEELRPEPALLAKAHTRMASAMARSGDAAGAARSLEEAQLLLPESVAIREQLEGLRSDPADAARAPLNIFTCIYIYTYVYIYV